jgi:hypothetical protein
MIFRSKSHASFVAISAVVMAITGCNQTASVGTTMQVSGYAFSPPALLIEPETRKVVHIID